MKTTKTTAKAIATKIQNNVQKNNEKIPADVRKRAAAESDPAKAAAVISAWRRSQVAAKGAAPAAAPTKAEAIKRDAAKTNAKKEATKGAKKGNGVPSVNGIKFKIGESYLVVRAREGAEDYRQIPNEVVRASFVGFNSETGAYLFDDGRTAQGVWLEAGNKRETNAADRLIFPVAKPKTARKSCDALNADESLWFGREDYAKAGLMMAAVSSKADVFGPALDVATAKERAVMASAIGANPFKLFAGMAGDEDAQRAALRKAWKGAHKKDRETLRATWEQVKSVRAALVKRFGEAVKVSSREADETAAAAPAKRTAKRAANA